MDVRHWTLMPNPAREQAWVQGVNATDAVSLLDANGRQVSTWRQGNVAQLELGALSAGLYHVVVTSASGGDHHSSRLQ